MQPVAEPARKAVRARLRTDYSVHRAARLEADRLAGELLFDENAWIREFARQRSRTLGATDFAERYRFNLSTWAQDSASGVLLGLMETGTSTDAKLTVTFLRAPHKKTRIAALRATHALAGAEAEGPLLDALASSSRALSALARNFLRGSRNADTTSKLVALVDSPHAHVSANALRLVHDADKWTGLLIALRLRSDDDVAVARHAKNDSQLVA